MKLRLINIILLISTAIISFSHDINGLRRDISRIIDKAPGTIGVAFVTDADTITFNNGVRYPMMSVFKLHQAIAVANKLEKDSNCFDKILIVNTDSLDHHTWSPMLNEFNSGEVNMTIGQLIDYSISLSDNNASNLMFESIVSPEETDDYIKSISEDTTFSILHSEATMKNKHSLSYQNWSSPLSAALLIKNLFSKNIVSPKHTQAIRNALINTVTGQDRIGKPLTDINGLIFAHKTGSGYRNTNNELIAHNDVGYIQLPDGRNYALAIMIRDFYGSEEDASRIMSEISKRIYCFVSSGNFVYL